MSEVVAATQPSLPIFLKGGRSFCFAMLAVTILPVPAVPMFGAEPEISGHFDLDILWVIFFFARGHVALTLLLYFDKTFLAITKSHPIRLIVAPLVLLLALPFVLMIDDRLLKISVFVVFVWNIWHFHKAAPAHLFYGCAVAAILFLWSLFLLKGGYLAGALDSHMGTQAVLRWVQAFAVTALFAHFVIDGGAFRLREKGPRDWMRARMGAVMSPG